MVIPKKAFTLNETREDTYQVNPGRLATDSTYFETIVSTHRRRTIK
jgi:hypothetical protein